MLCEFCANKVGKGGVSASILLRGEGRVIRGGGTQKKKSPDFRSSEVGISGRMTRGVYIHVLILELIRELLKSRSVLHWTIHVHGCIF